jgi:hypothetical protein
VLKLRDHGKANALSNMFYIISKKDMEGNVQ